MNNESIEGGLYLAKHRSACLPIHFDEKQDYDICTLHKRWKKLGRKNDIMNGKTSRIPKGF